MANADHLALLQQGTAIWNDWRIRNPGSLPDLLEADLKGANLSKADLTGANLREADLRKANLSGAHLVRANLREADLKWADLRGADLSEANLWDAVLCHANLRKATLSKADLTGALLIQADLCAATLTGSSVYGTAAWDIKVDDQTKQENLVITPAVEPAIMVDNIKVAQFVYLLLNNEEIRGVIDTITSKAVLILGRFTPERKEILDALQTALRKRGFVPITFDFDRPTNKDFTETIMTLAGMSCFIIADITKPQSTPLELQAAVPNYMIPFVPIIQKDEKPFSMFRDLHHKYHWVLPPLSYDSPAALLARLKNAIIVPALEMRDKLVSKKAQELPTRSLSDYAEDDQL